MAWKAVREKSVLLAAVRALYVPFGGCGQPVTVTAREGT